LRMRTPVAALLAGLMISGSLSEAAMAARMQVIVPPPAGVTLSAEGAPNALTLKSRYGMPPQLLRQVVAFRTRERAGTIIVKTQEKRLYLVLPGGRALRYAIGVAKDGFEWSGTHSITAKREWP